VKSEVVSGIDSTNPERENREVQRTGVQKNRLGTAGTLNMKREGSKITNVVKKVAKKVTYADVVMRRVTGTAGGNCVDQSSKGESNVMLSLLEINPIIGGKV
jgi:hypothetical protein